MSWLTDTIAGRTVLVLFFGLGSILALAHFLYQRGIEREISAADADRLAERLLLLNQTLTSVAPDKRDEVAHSLSGGPLELHWSREPLAIAGGNLDTLTLHLRATLLERAPDLSKLGLIIGTTRGDKSHEMKAKGGDGHHTTLISLGLEDGSWVNVNVARVQSARVNSPNFLITASLAALGILFLATLMGRWLTGPLDRLAGGARQLFAAAENAPLPEEGTREVRMLAVAINDLKGRIQGMIDDRTQMLAAISHDLRTPLTRLRLRAGALRDRELKRSIEADLDEMSQMIDATLSFLRDDASSEKVQAINLGAILYTIADEAADLGEKVEVAAPRDLVLKGRHLALKRALANVVQNGVKYGGCARVDVSTHNRRCEIAITDEGPGIPTDRMENVFEPFFRLDESRSRGTGGHGLGLTVARTIIRSHGGEISLSNLSPRGLRVLVSLPLE